MPIAATWVAFLTTAQVTFSHPLLLDLAGDTANWFVRVANVERTVMGVTIGAGPGNNRVDLTTLAAGADFGPDVVSFSPPPFDVVSDTVKPQPAPAFADLPLL